MSDINSTQNKFLIVVAGPTGIGKSALSMKLAQRYHADIFSADSRQIYKEMTIGTAIPSGAELAAIQHHFIGEVSVNESYSVGSYVIDFHKRLENYFLTKDIAIVNGGTGLYINAALEGIDTFPDISNAISMEVQKQYQEFGLSYIQDELLQLDSDYFHKVDIQNPRRILRALEVIKSTGKPYSSFLGQISGNSSPYKIIQILLELPRDVLYDKINNRVDNMIEIGLEKEARSLYHLKHCRALQTVGYTEMFDFFDDKHTLSRAIDLIKQNSRRYAKRQITWFKKYGNWNSFQAEDFESIFSFINKSIE